MVEATGVRTNKDGAMDGYLVTTLSNPGFWPHFLKNGSAINGGIPQLGNLSLHEAALAAFIDEKLPANFSGAAVVDFEAWNPLWSQGSPDDKYHNASRAAVRAALDEMSKVTSDCEDRTYPSPSPSP